MNVLINKKKSKPLTLKVSELLNNYLDIRDDLKKYIVTFTMMNEANGVFVILNDTAELIFKPHELTNITNATHGDYYVSYKWKPRDLRHDLEGKCRFRLINIETNDIIDLPSEGELTVTIN
jgi:hypothetical protein